jgi:prevent-host-death family protein
MSEAKAQVRELLAEAVRDGPQTVTRHGEALVLVVPPKPFSPQPEPDSFWDLPLVHQPGLTLSDADIDAPPKHRPQAQARRRDAARLLRQAALPRHATV